MKNLMFFALTLMLSFGLVACSNNDKQEEKPNILLEKSSTPSPEVEIGDAENDDVASNNADESSDETGIIDESAEPAESDLQEISYEIVHTESDSNFPALFVTVPNQNIDQLKLIAQELKSEYPSNDFTGVNVVFFTEDYQQEASNHDSSNAFAKLIVNHKGNVSKLIFFDNQKPIHIK